MTKLFLQLSLEQNIDQADSEKSYGAYQKYQEHGRNAFESRLGGQPDDPFDLQCGTFYITRLEHRISALDLAVPACCNCVFHLELVVTEHGD